MKYYAYLWLREDGVPYYAGKGSGGRAWDLKKDHKVKPPENESRILIFYRSSEEEAFETEIELISNWGREDNKTGCLKNLTNGGDGGSGYRFTDEQKKLVSLRKMGHSTSKEARRKMSEAHLGKPNLKTRGHKNYQNATTEQLREWGKIAQDKQVGIFAPGFDRTKGIREERAKLSPEEKTARATKASHSIPPEQRVLNGKAGAALGHHIRYHINRGTVSPSCVHCKDSNGEKKDETSSVLCSPRNDGSQ